MRISAIIPAYNAETCLGQCLDSVFAQTLPPGQIIVVNDGSEDGTGDIARRYGERILYMEQSNKGQGAARNAGLEVATGQYVAFLDADDYWRPEFLETCCLFLDRHPEAVAVSTAYVIERWGRERCGPAGLLKDGADPDGWVLENFFDTWAEHDHVRTGTVLIRRSVIEQAGGQLDIRVSQDLEYWGYLATFGPWGFIPKALWVGGSRTHAARSGWLAKYNKRRTCCPTVEQWQRRILPRLTPKQREAFHRVRGRVAKGYAHNKLLAGRFQDALSDVLQYGQTFPPDGISRVLVRGAKMGRLGWLMSCLTLRAREYSKGVIVRHLR